MLKFIVFFIDIYKENSYEYNYEDIHIIPKNIADLLTNKFHDEMTSFFSTNFKIMHKNVNKNFQIFIYENKDNCVMYEEHYYTSDNYYISCVLNEKFQKNKNYMNYLENIKQKINNYWNNELKNLVIEKNEELFSCIKNINLNKIQNE